MSATDWNELDGYEALVSQLRANAPVAAEGLRERVLEGAPAPRRRRSRKQRLLFVVVPAAIVLSVGAALVHGLVSTGPRSDVAAQSGVLSLAPHSQALKRTATGSGSVHTKGRALGPAQKKGTYYGLQEKIPGTTVAASALQADHAAQNTASNPVTIPRHRLV